MVYVGTQDRFLFVVVKEASFSGGRSASEVISAFMVSS